MTDASSPSPGSSAREISQRLSDIKSRIARYRDPSEVEIITVSKGFSVDVIRAARGVGLVHFGENYVQEFVVKAVALQGEELMASWSFIGGLQRNKIAKIAKWATEIHTVSRAEELAKLRELNYGGGLFIQVRADDDPKRGGVVPVLVPALVDLGRSQGLKILGLMGVASLSGGLRAPEFFRLVRQLADKCQLDSCSMGMSEDFELAVAEGATHLRLGRALLGHRASVG